MTDPEVPDPDGEGDDDSSQITLSNPGYWRAHPDALKNEALADASGGHLAAAGHESPVHSVLSKTASTVARATVALAAVVIGGAVLHRRQQRCLTLTVEEAAERLGISRAHAYEAVRRGEIPSIKIRRRILVPIAALDQFLASAMPDGTDHLTYAIQPT
jgi:excisionase family DNA binding protein